MHFLVTITACLFIVFVFSEIAYRFKSPIVIAQLICGIIIGLPIIRSLVIGENIEIITVLAELGIIFLLFLAGLDVEWNKLYGARKDVVLIAVFGALIPIALGFFVMKLLGYSTVISFITGICLGITSEGTKARVLMEINKIKTRLGSIMLGAGIIDDAIGFFLFMLISYLLGKEILSNHFRYTSLEIIGFIALAWLTFKLLPRLIRFEERETKEFREISLFTTVLLLCLVFAIFGQLISGTTTGALITAFVAGIVIQLTLKKRGEIAVRSHFEIMALSFIIPFFFIGIGLQFDFGSLLLNIPLMITITLVAIIGKIVGAIIIKPLTNLSLKQLNLVGWSMNSRGAVELVIALLALKIGLLPLQIYSAIVVMTLITTLTFPFVLRFLIKKYPGIMN